MEDVKGGGSGVAFQREPGVIRWKLHFRSAPSEIYRALATPEGRNRYWAESTEERDGVIHFIVPGGLECDGRIIAAVPDKRFATEYFGWTVTFDLTPDASSGGTDLEMTCRNIPAADRMEVLAGWVSVLMAMKAAVDFNVDLRNHDPHRTWWQGYADN